MSSNRPKRSASNRLEIILAREKTEYTNFDYPVGLKINAAYVTSKQKNEGDQLEWYPGVIVGHNNDGTYKIDYEDGDSWDRVPSNYVELREGSVPEGKC